MRTLLLALALSATTSTAFAADYAIYPGSMCVSYDGDLTVVGVDAGALYNNDDTNSLQVTCPIVRDTTTATSMTVTVYVYDKNGAENFSCDLKARSMTSHDTVTTVSGSTSGSSSSAKSISLSGLSLSSSSKVYLVCDIPPVYDDSTSFIAGYKVTES